MVTMATSRCLRLAFLLGSVLMIVLIIIYWDDMGSLHLYPHEPHPHPTLPLPPQPHNRPGEGRTGEEQLLTHRTNPSDHDKEKTEVEWRRQEERKRRISDVCSANGTVEFPGKLWAFDQIPNRELDHLIVDDRHEIIYCYVPKVACTNWKRVMVVLSEGLLTPEGQPYRSPQDVPPELIHNSSLHLTFSKFWRRYGRLSRHLMKVKLQSYTKFLFVRDPFVRLISAFRNKFQQPNEDFYRQFGSVMLRRYGNRDGKGNSSQRVPESAAEAFTEGIRPTFSEFVKYLLDPETERKQPFNEHWRQVYRLCHPCQIQYDFIGTLENLEADSDQLLRILGLEDQISFPPSSRNRTSTNWERDWFNEVPEEQRRKLYSMYEPDFKLFGYPKPESLLHQ
ncbi:hypothetical protein DPEC_G00369550 [Dallia pectoralis]|nr:hypothetical protein DPEC_G00369550 [Dallia pectoralis]